MVRRVLLLLVLVGCKLTETLETPPGDPVVQVQAVIDPTRASQRVLVERSQPGTETTGITGAVVTLTDLDPRGCATPVVQLVDAGNGVYTTVAAWCSLAAGDRVALRVTTPEGTVVTGTTRIPGIRSITVRAGTTSAPAMLTMDRTRDSIHVTADLSLTHAMQVEAVRTTTNENATLRFVSDTLSLGIAGDLVDPFDDRTIFRAGCYYELTVAALDTNYFDFTRSITNPLTGQGFINHLSGGIGVFGSVVPVTYQLRVVAPQMDPREGVYRLAGRVGGAPVDVTWDVYRDALSANRIRAFVDGQWGSEVLHTSANGSYTDDVFRGTLYSQNSPPAPAYTLIGTRTDPGTSFPVVVRVATPNPSRADTVMAVQISGPAGP